MVVLLHVVIVHGKAEHHLHAERVAMKIRRPVGSNRLGRVIGWLRRNVLWFWRSIDRLWCYIFRSWMIEWLGSHHIGRFRRAVGWSRCWCHVSWRRRAIGGCWCSVSWLGRVGWLRRVVLGRNSKDVFQQSSLDRWSVALGRVVDFVQDGCRWWWGWYQVIRKKLLSHFLVNSHLRPAKRDSVRNVVIGGADVNIVVAVVGLRQGERVRGSKRRRHVDGGHVVRRRRGWKRRRPLVLGQDELPLKDGSELSLVQGASLDPVRAFKVVQLVGDVPPPVDVVLEVLEERHRGREPEAPHARPLEQDRHFRVVGLTTSLGSLGSAGQDHPDAVVVALFALFRFG